MTAIVVNEPPPLDLCVLVETPGNVRTRWGWDDPNPDLVPTNMTFGTAMPGGFTQCNITLERAPERFYPDSKELSKLTIQGAGGTVAWQGRIEKLPDTAGYEAQESPEAVGYQAALEDDNSVREIYVDAELSKWEDPSTARRIQLAEANYSQGSSTASTDPTDGNPALVQLITGNWASPAKPMVESMYDANGIKIAFVYTHMFGNKAMQEAQTAGAEVHAEIVANEDDHYTGSDGTGNLGVLGIAQYTSLPAEPFYMVRTWFEESPGGVAQVNYELLWEGLTAYGTHGLTLRGSAPGGLFASDVVAHAVGKWTPEIAFSTGPEGTIKQSLFIVPQLAFLEPTTVAEVIKQATRFELPDWAVWEGPTLYMNPRGERGRKWQARVGPSQLQESGPQISRLWNGVCVAYTDVTGKARMVGPPGFAGGTSETEDSNLLEANPENPLNELGIRKWALLKMGTSTVEGAKAVGRIYLQEQKARELQGQAALIGYVEDEQGTSWPAWMVRAGDTIRFVDASITAPRTIVNTSYDDTTKTNTISLEQPPENMQALLERLAVSIENVATS
jgi:hypothetical protein